MKLLLNKYRVVAFSIIGALIIIGATLMMKSSESNDTWLYVFSIWMILFSVFEVRPSLRTSKISKLAVTILVGVFLIILGAWWINGAEHARLFLACTTILVVSFFVLLPQKK